jgi:hypothetical protein
MKIFISWSGNMSKSLGEVLRKYLPTIIQGTDVFLSAHDIESGAKWAQTLSEELENTNYGILCLTPYNLDSRWLLFEAGALSKLQGSAVCGLLIGNLKLTDIEAPLSQFQNKRFTMSGLKALLIDINKKLNKSLESETLSLLFDTFWPQIEEEYNNVISDDDQSRHIKRSRTELELLEEILFRVRGIEKQETIKRSFRGIGLDSLLEMPVNYATLAAYSEKRFPTLKVSERWHNRLLADLNTQNYPFIRDIDNAVTIAMPALEEFAGEAPDLFTYSTDFLTKALGFVDKGFRDVHPWGDRTQQAFEKYSSLVNKR